MEMKKMIKGNKRKTTVNGNQKVVQGATAAAVIGGAGLAGFYAWQNAAKKKSRGFMNKVKPSSKSRLRIFSR